MVREIFRSQVKSFKYFICKIIFLLMSEHIYFFACYSLISNSSASKIFTLLLHLNYYFKTIFEILSYKLFTSLQVGNQRLVVQNPHGFILSHKLRVNQPLHHQRLPLDHANIRDHWLKSEDSLVDNSSVALKTEMKIEFYVTIRK